MRKKKKNRIKKIEEEIQKNDGEIKSLEELSNMQEYATDYTKAMELSQKIEELKKQNEVLFEEWSSLSE